MCANYIGKNNVKEEMKEILKLVKENSHTNIILTCIPQRYDLLEWSCVNTEMESFNRKLGKSMKKNSKYVTVCAQHAAATSIALFQGEKDNNRNIKGNNMQNSIQMMTKTFGKPFPKIRLTNTTSNEIEKIIRSIQSKNVYGYDEVSTKIKKKKCSFYYFPLKLYL
jgi:hypothetical protein